jgi:ABC-2 type transport system permease protein
VEDYRFRLMQKLNVEIKHHKPQSGERHYATEIASITRDVIYRPGELSLYDVAKAQAPNLAILLVWAVFAIGLTGVSAQRLGQRW